MRLMQRDTQGIEASGRLAQIPRGDAVRHPIEHRAGEELGGGIFASKLVDVVEIAVIELAEDLSECGTCETDVDDYAIGIELAPAQLEIYDESGAMQSLRRAE